MTLKMKLTALIASFTLVIGLMLMGVFAVNQATVNMGGSISFTATDVYARVTGSIANDTSSPSNLDVTYSAEETTGDPTVWNDLSLAFDSQATPIEVTITVENLSPQNTLRVNLNDTLSSTIGNLEKVVKNDGEDYTNQTDITLQPNGQADDSTTFTITMSVMDKNTSLTADFDYELNLFYQYYVEPQKYEYFEFTENGDGTVTLTEYYEDLATSTDIVIPESVSYVDGVWMDGDTYTVTAIADGQQGGGWIKGVFGSVGNHLTITSLILPQTLIRIGDYAFTNCNIFTSIDLPSSLESIGQNVFPSNSLPPSIVDQGVKYLGNSENPYLVLWDGTDITPSTYTVNEKCKIIYYSAFSNCSGLTSITLPSSLTSIGSQAFRNCSGLTEVDLSNCTSLTSIEIYAFNGCNGLERIVFPNTTGWYRANSSTETSGTDLDMSDPEQNATWLTDTYNYYYFKRNA